MEKNKILLDEKNISNNIFFNPLSIIDKSNDNSNIKTILETKENLSIHPNETEIKHQKHLYIELCKKMYNNIKQSDNFGEGINLEFISTSLKEADAILFIETIETNSRDNKTIYGFSTLNFINFKNVLHLDLICSNNNVKGCGSYILNLLKEICAFVNLDSIILNSVTSAIPFYLKNHFICDELCKMKLKISGG
jgi:hypothetical protein